MKAFSPSTSIAKVVYRSLQQMMHPDIGQLAAYLDSALGSDERAALRAHILTCTACAVRLERLRDDARQITTTLSTGGAEPDVRAAVRARLRRPALGRWLCRGLAVAGAVAALLLFAMMLGAGSHGTASGIPDQLFVTDKQGGMLVVLDARDGSTRGETKLGENPTSITYDEARGQLYVMLKQSIIAVDPYTLQVVRTWSAPRPFDLYSGMALDARRTRLYVAQPGSITVLALDTPEIAVAQTYEVGQSLNVIALSPDGETLYALDWQQARLWTIDIIDRSVRSQTLAQPYPGRFGGLAVSRDRRFVYVLLTRAGRDDQPALWRIDHSGASDAPRLLNDRPPPWDMELLGTSQLAIPRGDGVKGGVELVDSSTLSTVARIDEAYDQHHVSTGPDGAVFGLNFTRRTVTRFDGKTQGVVWRTPEDQRWQPWDGVYVPGSWRLPW